MKRTKNWDNEDQISWQEAVHILKEFRESFDLPLAELEYHPDQDPFLLVPGGCSELPQSFQGLEIKQKRGSE